MGFSEYKIFNRAAQEAGIDDNDERKLIAMEPNMLLEEASPEFKRQIAPKTLQGFFEFLNKGQSGDGKEAVRLGNVLYQYRSDERAEKNFTVQDERHPRVLNEQDQKIINLGCHLIEDSFYSGKLNGLDSKSSAAAAFVFNNLAKIFQSQKELSGFNKEKFNSFIGEVSQFENDKLFEKYIDPKAADKKMSGQENLDRTIAQESSLLEEFMKQDWDKYRSELNNKLRESFKILQRVDYLRLGDVFREKAESIFLSWPQIMSYTNEYAARLSVGKGYKGSGPGPFDNQFRNSTVCLSSLQSNFEKNSDVSFFRNELELLRKKAQSSVSGKTKKYNDLSTFGLETSKDLAPDAIRILEEVFENKGQGLFNQYILQIKKVESLKEQLQHIALQDKHFQASRNQILQKRENSSTIPYFFKSCIIASNLRDTKYDRGESLKVLVSSTPNKAVEHLFCGQYDYNVEGKSTMSSPNYANVHYLPGDMPLAVWTVEYFESLLKSKGGIIGDKENKNR